MEVVRFLQGDTRQPLKKVLQARQGTSCDHIKIITGK
jgi:translation initiation factor 1 (eIF-1/SUI1)